MTDGPTTDTKIVDAEFIYDLFQPSGAVTVRRMFGGAGLFADGVMFGLVSDGQIYLKVDATTATCLNVSDASRSSIQPRTAEGVTSYGGYPNGSMTTPTNLLNGQGKHSRPRARVRRQSRKSERDG